MRHLKMKTAFVSMAFAATAALACQSALAADAASAAGLVRTGTSPLTVRASASASAARVASLAKGSSVTLLSKSGSWWRVEYAPGRYGYCHADYIAQLPSTQTAVVSTSGGNLNIRAAASSAAAVRTTLPKGTWVVVLSETNGWSRVLYNGTQIGYAGSQYLRSAQGDTSQGGYAAIALNVADYKQYDSRWAKMKLGSSGKTMSAIGCTTTALAETESYRTATTVTPAMMAQRLYYSKSGDLAWPSHYGAYTGSDYLGMLYRRLQEGKPTIIGVKTAAGKGHWAVVTGFTGGTLRADRFTINDPGSASRATLGDLMREYPRFYKLEYYY